MMTFSKHDLVVQVSDLVNRPGTSRPVHFALPVPEDLELPLVGSTGPVELDGVIESVVEGLLVRGTLRTTMQMACARCLTPSAHAVSTDVVELFAEPGAPGVDGEEVERGYEIREGTIDLELLVRDALVPAVPFRPLCRPDCAGLCPVCGGDRNEVACSCEQTTTDSRWAALEGLKLPPESAPDTTRENAPREDR